MLAEQPTSEDRWMLRMPWSEADAAHLEPLITREWLVANGLGGYASGTVSGVTSRRYHGLLIAALPAPLGRRVMLNHLTELIRLPDGTTLRIGGEERGRQLQLHGADLLREFRLEMGLPVWRYEFGDYVLEKRIILPHRQNTVFINYRLVEGTGIVRLKLRPAIHFRGYEEPVSAAHFGPCSVACLERRVEVASPPPLPPLRLFVHGERVAFTLESDWLPDLLYRVEESRGYEATGSMWTPGYFRGNLTLGQDLTLVASTELWEVLLALPPREALQFERERREHLLSIANANLQVGPASELVLAGDQFIITPSGRVVDEARTRATGDEVRTVIAGYHWFTDWGRDTMVSLEGLTLATGRHTEAGYILRTFGQYVRDGLIPNFFPDGQNEGLYHTADATLWFFHAVQRYLVATGDRVTLRTLLPKLQDIVDHHICGTRFGIGIDPADGLLRQGQHGYQLTWMDAKVDDWVVTPRRGKAVEINALWYNALRLLQTWLQDELGEQQHSNIARLADQVRQSFNDRFWNPDRGYLYDVVDGESEDDESLRPNQLFAISLDHPVLDPSHWSAVLDAVTKHLLTPVGLRSLAPGHPDYKPRYFGDLRARDAAYHQGTVWAWLIGPFIDAYLAVHPEDRKGARRYLDGLVHHLGEACIGSISEVFDAESPYTPRGCIAQAWSVAEMMRTWVRTAEKV